MFKAIFKCEFVFKFCIKWVIRRSKGIGTKEENSQSPFGPVGSTGTGPVFNIFSSNSSCSSWPSSSFNSSSSMGSPACGPLAMAFPISSARAFWSPRPSLKIMRISKYRFEDSLRA